MEKKYKFKSLQVYSSDEWMANSTKRYRTVYDRKETSYVRVELAFYNKLFDEEDWECKLELKAFRIIGEERKELCNLDSKRKISKEDNIVYVRDGWGNPNIGAYWSKGTYNWEAFIDGELVGVQKFHIEDIGVVTSLSNPYFELEYLKLYTGAFDGWKQENRKYLTKINRNTTQYLWAEFRIKNKISSAWNYELFFNFFDDAGQPKGHVTRTGQIQVNKKDFRYTFDAGWGNETPGSWKDDKYKLEIVFMDTLVAAVTFECGDEEIEGIPDLLHTIEETMASSSRTSEKGQKAMVKEQDNRTLNELIADLDNLIGLENIKKNIKENITYLNFTKLRKEKGFEDSGQVNLHSVFTGNPGTGKTTVVKMLGKIYKKMGLLSKGHVYEVDRSMLVAEFIGQTAPKTKKAIDMARGGILFIDEAYALSRKDDDGKDFGKEVIEIILKEMSDGKGDVAVICAGYPKEIERFLDSNPGLKSRFTNYFHFDDYLPEELYAISNHAALNKEIVLDEHASHYLKEQLTEVYRRRDLSFGNARYINALLDEAKMNMGIRLMKEPDMNALTKEQLQTVFVEDLKPIFTQGERKKLKLKINEKHLQEALNELNELIGMDEIKQEVNELVKLIRFYNEIGKDVVNKFSLHSLFSGNPGTGKTTLARIIAKIYKSLGLLERGHVVEVDREALVAGYHGQTAIKTVEKIQEAMGGILFIDEAYSLNDNGNGNDFGKEAIEIILKRMEDNRGKFGVIAAGYPDNMIKFIEMNPGLKSRFDKVFKFEDYNANQLYSIAISLLHKETLTPDEEAEAHLKNYFSSIYNKRDKFFGNARTVRQVVAEAVKNQNLRMASIHSSKRSIRDIETLCYEDVKEFTLNDVSVVKGKLGFRFGNH